MPFLTTPDCGPAVARVSNVAFPAVGTREASLEYARCKLYHESCLGYGTCGAIQPRTNMISGEMIFLWLSGRL